MLDWLIMAVEPIHILASGGTLAQAVATDGAKLIVAGAAFLIPSTLIGLSLGMTEWRETPLAQVLGWRPSDGEMNWLGGSTGMDGDND